MSIQWPRVEIECRPIRRLGNDPRASIAASHDTMGTFMNKVKALASHSENADAGEQQNEVIISL